MNNNKLIEMLKRHEGVETHAYKCSASKITVGVGRNIDPEGGLGLSEDEVDYLLQNDIKRIISELDFQYEWFSNLNEARKDAMIDISFNLGQTRLRKFEKALTAMSQNNWDKAADEFMDSKWSNQVGNRAKELTAIIRIGKY
tara:strand:- start:148 stop:573 length:426 start_codon:yes stop_codon:yes gene_type:complete